MEETPQECIDRLVAEGRARRQRGKYVAWVDEWQSLTPKEQALVRRARAQYRPRPSQPSRYRQEKERARRERARKVEANRPARREARKYGHLTHTPPPDGMERWQKAAWWEASREIESPAFVWAKLAGVVGWISGVAILLTTFNPWLAAFGLLSTWVIARAIFKVSIYWPYRRRVERRARVLLEIFEDARKRSRTIPTALRLEVLERDNHTCVYCGTTSDLHIDHKHPHSRGGLSEANNLQVLCGPCNIKKGTMSDTEARRLLGK